MILDNPFCHRIPPTLSHCQHFFNIFSPTSFSAQNKHCKIKCFWTKNISYFKFLPQITARSNLFCTAILYLLPFNSFFTLHDFGRLISYVFIFLQTCKHLWYSHLIGRPSWHYQQSLISTPLMRVCNPFLLFPMFCQGQEDICVCVLRGLKGWGLGLTFARRFMSVLSGMEELCANLG